MGILSKIKLTAQNARFLLWQRYHRGATFKDYFASITSEHIRTGRAHPTLGGNLCEGEFGTAGKSAFKRLVSLGIQPDSVCVDYGCGTLRIGVHAMRYLNAGCYWGLDIDQSLLDAGARLIGPDLLAEKRPKLRVISPQTVREAAREQTSLPLLTGRPHSRSP